MKLVDDGGPQSPLQGDFERVLTERVTPFLRQRGFTRSELSFRRDRGEVYDVIGFQENWHNGVTPSFGFFINIGVGSHDVDAAWTGPRPQPVFQRRWESVVPDLPYEARFSARTNLTVFANALCESLDEVIAVIEGFDRTSALVRYAVTSNLLIQYEETCCYLAAISDLDTLTEYVGVLRDCFGHDDRWAAFNRSISEVAGSHAATLVQLGLLDPVAA